MEVGDYHTTLGRLVVGTAMREDEVAAEDAVGAVEAVGAGDSENSHPDGIAPKGRGEAKADSGEHWKHRQEGRHAVEEKNKWDDSL